MTFSSALFARLSRVTSTTRYIPAIDGLRFVAIIMVVLFHLQGDFWRHNPQLAIPAEGKWLTALMDSLHIGVKLFFVISGFVVALPFANQYLAGGRPVKLQDYFLRRLSRIEPPYLIALLVWSAANFLCHRQTLANSAQNLLLSAFYLHNFCHRGAPTAFFIAWSLEVEVQFYVLAPLLCRVFLIKQKLWRRVFLGSVTAALSLLDISVGLGANVLYFLHYFLLGLLLSDFYVLDWQNKQSKSYAWDAVSYLAWIGLALIIITIGRNADNDFLPLICFFFAFAGALRGVSLSWIFSRPFFVIIGGMCYTIYLYHPLIISMVAKLLSLLPPLQLPYWPLFAAHLALMLPIVLAISAVLFVLFEKPFMKMGWTDPLFEFGRRLLKKSQGKSAGA